MNKLRAALATAVVGACAAVGVAAVASAHGNDHPPLGPPARIGTLEPAPSMPKDLGVAEQLILVTAGTYDTKAAAETADAEFDFGEIQGFYAVPVSQFQGLEAQLVAPKPWVLASAFRTRAGAEEFAAIAQVAGASTYTTDPRVISLGGDFAGLGQEADPGGSGPLTWAVEASEPVTL